MAKILNNINLELHEASSKKARSNNGSMPVEKTIVGEFNMSGSPMFSAEIASEFTKVKLGCDEPTALGGKGVQPTPLTYILYGVMACYSSTLAAECAEEGLELNDLKIRGILSYDLGPVVSDSKVAIIKALRLEVISSSKLDEQIKRAWAKCPAVYAIQNPIETKILQANE